MIEEPLAKLGDMRAGINPAPTVFIVGDGFIPSLSVRLPPESGRDRVFARGSRIEN
jgi:hypothetical protein